MPRHQKRAIFILSCACLILISCMVNATRPVTASISKMGPSPSDLLTEQPITLAVQQGSISGTGKEIFWFLHVTDTQSIWDSTNEISQWKRFLNESYHTVQPLFIIHTGDIVDSDYYDFFKRGVGQQVWEWYPYQQSLQEASMNFSVYKDLQGNHDTYRSPGAAYFLNYSMAGQTIGKTYYSWNFTNSLGTFAFLGLNAPEDNGIEYPFSLFGYMNHTELDWYEKELETYKDAKMTIAFGHMPPYEIISSLSTSGKTWGQLNRQYGVDAYFVGHGHENTNEDAQGLRAIETSKFKGGSPPYRIVAVDGTTLSSQLAHVGQWPQAIITNPVQDNYLYRDYDRTQISNADSVRVLAWDPEGVTRVEVKLPGEDWQTAIHQEGALWELPVTSKISDGHIQARVTGGSGENTIQIMYDKTPDWHWTWIYGIISLTLAFIGLYTVIPLRMYLLRRKNPEKYAKKPDQKVDKIQLRLFLGKCLILLAVPLTFGLMLFESPVAVFGLFYATSHGAFFYANNLLFTGILWLAAVQPLGFFLSRAGAKKLMGWAMISIALEVFLLVFYLLHFPTISWIAPGFYGLMVLDVLMVRRATQLVKTS